MNKATQQPGAFAEFEVRIPPTFPGGRAHMELDVVTSRDLEELDAKIARAPQIIEELERLHGKRPSVRFDARYVRNPETGEYEPVDFARAKARIAAGNLWRFVRSVAGV